MPQSPAISETTRAWLSLWLVVHFFILLVCLVHNNGSSYLFRRLHQLTSPYSIVLMQDYGTRPIEMTTGERRSFPHLVQIHKDLAPSDVWEKVEPDELPLSRLVDHRWRNFEHMLAVAAMEDNEELVYVVFHHIAHIRPGYDAIRLVRKATLSIAQDDSYRAGKLPIEDLNDDVLYEARIVDVADSQKRLLPVIEKSRRAATLESHQ